MIWTRGNVSTTTRKWNHPWDRNPKTAIWATINRRLNNLSTASFGFEEDLHGVTPIDTDLTEGFTSASHIVQHI